MNESIPIRIFVKDKELYDFCKQDSKRLYNINVILLQNILIIFYFR
ncbi:plasmid partition family protein [Borreliella bavariensis]|nr:plasmid partition family protein [Borreliella bavariensis]